MSDIDVLVIGSGIAGLSAAIAARQAGAESVIIAEAAGGIGGASRLSSGLIVGAGTAMQATAGIADSAELMFRDYMNANQWGLDGGVTRRLAAESGPTIDWLVSLGAEFHPTPVSGGYETQPRCAVAIDEGQGLIDALARAARNLDIDVALGQRVDRLLVKDGVVVGAAVGDDELSASAVIIASGGFGSNPEKIAEFYPSLAKAGDWLWYVGEDGSHGDAIDLGQQVGARITGHDTGCSMLAPGFTRSHETYLPGWLVIVDPDGQRFIAENAHYSALDRQAVLRGGRFFVLFDSQALDPEAAKATPFYAGGSKAYPGRTERTSPNWNPDILREMVAAGRIPFADSIAELAVAVGVPDDQLEATIAEYNEGAQAGLDRMGKYPEFLRPLEKSPFYAAEIRLSEIVITGTGLQIDPEARVLDALGCPIPGLFAAGEATGGVIWPFYPSSGSSLGHGAAFGRVAGTNAAARSIAGA
ncbi:FAD-dependent oxidoreductase [Arthrobacter sp. AZCC_0090]|uniref:FAD-dependent oxidoreductase n=1 Tax=Arthrobacter sp. AZCC_0090 TaxID=2735881 RepID=UPI00160F4C08|nr:FAD-dependent oxidoreductase [Arthrobacter sp. AZCC_0090]MBB6407188.1 fumarate reductase flavoprotein subunit [Arthrobacter sp. AZCC_0090]